MDNVKVIKTWNELSKLINDKYKVIVEDCCGWIVPICDEYDENDPYNSFICNCPDEIKNGNFYAHHVYLSTHTFYGSNYKYSTEILKEYGFDVEIDNWDKKVK